MDKYKWKYRILLIDTPNYTNEKYIESKNIYDENIYEFHKRACGRLVKVKFN